MNRRILHDSAHSTALVLLEVVKPCLREEEWHNAYGEFYSAVRQELEAYERQVRCTALRPRPARPGGGGGPGAAFLEAPARRQEMRG